MDKWMDGWMDRDRGEGGGGGKRLIWRPDGMQFFSQSSVGLSQRAWRGFSRAARTGVREAEKMSKKKKKRKRNGYKKEESDLIRDEH